MSTSNDIKRIISRASPCTSVGMRHVLAKISDEPVVELDKR